MVYRKKFVQIGSVATEVVNSGIIKLLIFKYPMKTVTVIQKRVEGISFLQDMMKFFLVMPYFLRELKLKAFPIKNT